MSAILAALPYIAQLVQTGIGAFQSMDNERPKDPKYTIPPEVYGYLGEMKNRTTQGMPGLEMMKENVMSEASGMTNTLKETAVSGASLQGSVNQLAGGVTKQMTGLEIMNSQFKDSARVDYANALLQMADYKDKQFDFNVNRPYQMAMTEYFNKKNSAEANLFGGLSGLSEYAFMGDAMGLYDKPGETTGTTGDMNLQDFYSWLGSSGVSRSNPYGNVSFGTGAGKYQATYNPSSGFYGSDDWMREKFQDNLWKTD